MQSRIFFHLALVILFAFAQIGIATHSVEHIGVQLSESHDSSSHSDSPEQHTSGFQCPQCIAQSHADVATIQSDFILQLANAQHVFLDNQAASQTASASEYFFARAPPTFI